MLPTVIPYCVQKAVNNNKKTSKGNHSSIWKHVTFGTRKRSEITNPRTQILTLQYKSNRSTTADAAITRNKRIWVLCLLTWEERLVMKSVPRLFFQTCQILTVWKAQGQNKPSQKCLRDTDARGKTAWVIVWGQEWGR